VKRLAILGSTGSIGCNTLKVIKHLGDIRVVAMAAGRNISAFSEQIAAFRPALVSVETQELAEELLQELHRLECPVPKIERGENGLIAVATHPEADTVVSATVGAVGFVPTLRAIEAGKRIALANKETLVMAGELMTAAAKKSGAEILPVDSEHSAAFQAISGSEPASIERIVLTASLTEPLAVEGAQTPHSPYAAAKWAASGYGRMFHELYGTPVVMLRPFMTYGPGQAPSKLIPAVTLSLLRGERPKRLNVAC